MPFLPSAVVRGQWISTKYPCLCTRGLGGHLFLLSLKASTSASLAHLLRWSPIFSLSFSHSDPLSLWSLIPRPLYQQSHDLHLEVALSSCPTLTRLNPLGNKNTFLKLQRELFSIIRIHTFELHCFFPCRGKTLPNGQRPKLTSVYILEIEKSLQTSGMMFTHIQMSREREKKL